MFLHSLKTIFEQKGQFIMKILRKFKLKISADDIKCWLFDKISEMKV